METSLAQLRDVFAEDNVAVVKEAKRWWRSSPNRLDRYLRLE